MVGDDYTGQAALIDRELRVLRLGLQAILLVTAWSDVLIGLLMFSSLAVGTMGLPALAYHFAYVPVQVWAGVIFAAGALQLSYATRPLGLAAAAAWHTCFAFPFVYIAVQDAHAGPHYAVAIYLSAAFTRAVKCAVITWLRRDRRKASRHG